MMSAFAVACAVTLMSLTSVASAAGINVSGTWSANYHCESGWCAGSNFPATDILTQAEGSRTVTGSNGSETISGTLTGYTFNYESKVGSYKANGTLTVSADGLSWSGHASDNNGTSGTYTATRRSGGPASEPAASGEESGCIDGCTNFQFKADPTLEPGQTSMSVGVGCGGGSAPAATASDTTAPAGSGCMTGLTMQAAEPGSMTTPTEMQDANQKAQLERWKILQDTQTKVFEGQQSVTEQKAKTQSKEFKKWDDYIRASTDPTDATALAAADSALAGEFPTDTTSTSASASAAALNIGPEGPLVLASIYAAHPTAADVKAFSQEIALATSPTYSPARAVARLTLVLAVAIGRRVIAHDLGYKRLRQLASKPVILGSASARVAKRGKARLTIKASALGARYLRLLSVVGLSHKVTIQLRISVTPRGRTKRTSVTRNIRVR